jgi:hypothetical protein
MWCEILSSFSRIFRTETETVRRARKELLVSQFSHCQHILLLLRPFTYRLTLHCTYASQEPPLHV